MDTNLDVHLVTNETSFLSLQDANVFPENVMLGSSIQMRYAIQEASCSIEHINTSKIQYILNQTEIISSSIVLTAVANIVQDLVEQKALITNIVPARFATVAKAAEEDILQKSSLEGQTLSEAIEKFPVYYAGGAASNAQNIEKSIQSLDIFINALQNDKTICKGRSPGFETRESKDNWILKRHHCLSYETLPSVNYGKSTIPLPDVDIALKYFLKIRKTWVERLRWVNSPFNTISCSCISKWEHSNGNILSILANQVIEQAMIREASDSVTARMMKLGHKKGEIWDKKYAPNYCPTPSELDHIYNPDISLRIINDRNEFISKFVNLALRAKSSIDICTCYFFSHDPAQKYLFLYFLPFIAREHGVKIRLLCDMMAIESMALKGALRVLSPSQFDQKKTNYAARGGVAPFSFLDFLPPDAPRCTDTASLTNPSALSYLQEVLDTASSIPDGAFQFRWWCARDAEDKYRIKSHAKCILIDRKVSFIGGSNIFPTPEIGNSDLDLLVAGDITRKIGSTFDFLWEMMEPRHLIEKSISSSSVDTEMNDNLLISEIEWSDSSAKVAHVCSRPSSAGEDLILRNVLGAIKTAQKSIVMCMGHSNKPMALAAALGEAVKRGVTVKLLVNSLFSCDIRVNQRDLFLSLKDLLSIAPGVEVWATAMPSRRSSKMTEEEKKMDSDGDNGNAPPFLHAKYTVIDTKWAAVGSWNVWTRSAFYEIEHELFIHSEPVAKIIEEKFHRDIDETACFISSPEICAVGGHWCPSGCDLCLPFGPFYM